MARRILKAAAAYFAIVFGAGFAFGLLRVPFLVPVLGARMAELLEMPLMFIVILLAAQHVVTRFGLPQRAAPRAACGAVALVLLVGAEVAFVALRGLPLAAYVASRDAVSGTVYLVMLGVFAAMPAIIDRLRPPPPPPSA